MNTPPLSRATPFALLAARANRHNRWTARNGFTLVERYGCPEDEALAARTRTIVVDISWRWRVALQGARAADCLNRLMTHDVSHLAPGDSLKALWLTDNGGVRGAGVVARYSKESFVLVSAAPDAEWIAAAAQQFGIAFRDVTEADGGLAVIGPYAEALLRRAGLPVSIETLQVRRAAWQGIDVTLSRWGEHGGYEIWCNPHDASIVWDRLMEAGEVFGIQSAGVAAMDILDIEAGVARPLRDYEPARGGFDKHPTPLSLGLERLIEGEHRVFNGRSAWLVAREHETKRLVGIEIDSAQPAPHNRLTIDEQPIGHTIASCYSPALRRAIGLAQVDNAASGPGNAVAIALGPGPAEADLRMTAARVVGLPFLGVPDPIAS